MLYAKWLDPNPRMSSDYQAEAANLDMLEIYGHGDNSVVILYVFQIVFPLLGSILIALFIGCSYDSIKTYVQEHTKDPKGRATKRRATTWAYFFLCCMLWLFIITMDVLAIVYRDYNLPHSEYFRSNKLLFNYPLALLVCDLFFMFFPLVINFIFVCCMCRKGETKLSCVEASYLFMMLSGTVPLLCLASHIHYIFIALVTDPVNAGGIGVYIGITIFVQFFMVKKAYVVAPDRCECKCISNIPCKIVYSFIVWLLVLGCLAVITSLLGIIPLRHPVEEEATRLYTFLHGINTLVLALIAYKVIFDRKESSLSITGAIENVVQKMPGIRCRLYDSRTWNSLDEGERFNELLYHFLRHQEADDNLEEHSTQPMQAAHNMKEREQVKSKKAGKKKDTPEDKREMEPLVT